jgi:hypothetical protein
MSARWRRMTSSALFEAALAAATVVAGRASISVAPAEALMVLAGVVETADLIALSREVGPLCCVLPIAREFLRLAAC